jgi:hypothetical protein
MIITCSICGKPRRYGRYRNHDILGFGGWAGSPLMLITFGLLVYVQAPAWMYGAVLVGNLGLGWLVSLWTTCQCDPKPRTPEDERQLTAFIEWLKGCAILIALVVLGYLLWDWLS